MFIFKKIFTELSNPKVLLLKIFVKCPWLISDKRFLKYKFKIKLNKKLNLDNPQTYNEKLQWLKLYDRQPEYSRMVDKAEAKNYVKEIIGEKHIIPTLGEWNN